MKKLMVFAQIALVFAMFLPAQASDDAVQAYKDALQAYDTATQQLQRSNLRAQKREIIRMAISLTEEQTPDFWAIYDKYEAETTKINDTRLALINDYTAHRADLSSEKATELINGIMKAQQQRQEMKRSYVKDLGTVLTAKEALRLMLLEYQIDVQIDAQIAAQIPL